MKVWIDRELCEGNLATCLSCLGHLSRTGEAEGGCIRDYSPDGSKDITVFTMVRGQNWAPFIIPKTLLDMVAHQYRDGVLAPKIKIEF